MDVRMPDGTIITNVPEGITKAELLAKIGQAPAPSMKEPQTIYTEETIYDPVSGLPLSSPAYGPEATGGVKTAQKALTSAAAMPIQYATSVAKPIAGVAQMAGRLLGQPPYEKPAEAIQQMQTGLGQVAPSSKIGAIAGDILNPITLAAGGKAMDVASTATKLPAYARAILGGAGAGATAGALEPTKTGLTDEQYLAEKATQVGGGAAVGGAIPAVTPLVRSAGRGIANALGVSTGVGGQPIKEAFQAGVEGGEKAKILAQNLREQVPKTEVLDDAINSLNTMQSNLSKAYREGMFNVSKDKAILDFKGIDNSLKSISELGKFEGQVLNKNAQQAVNEVNKLVNNWKNLDPAVYHTPEGLDALKKQIGAVLEELPYEQKTARKAVGEVYTAVKKEIEKQAPEYSNIMKDYSQGMDLVSEIKRALSLGEKSSADTAMRKLQSLMRNNVNTNYGNRLELAKQLEQAGGKEIMPALAGQALSSPTPRGLVGQTADIGAVLAALSNPSALAVLPATSPRLVGEAALAAGKAARPVINLANSGTPEQRRLAQLLIMNSLRPSGD